MHLLKSRCRISYSNEYTYKNRFEFIILFDSSVACWFDNWFAIYSAVYLLTMLLIVSNLETSSHFTDSAVWFAICTLVLHVQKMWLEFSLFSNFLVVTRFNTTGRVVAQVEMLLWMILDSFLNGSLVKGLFQNLIRSFCVYYDAFNSVFVPVILQMTN